MISEIGKRFNLFVERANELRDLRLVKSGMQSKMLLHWDATSPHLTSSIQNPDEEDLRSFLLTFRQFISDREPVFVPRICNDAIRFMNDKEIQRELTAANNHWKKTFKNSIGFNLTINGKLFTGEYVLDLWINGFYFHNDDEKRKILESLSGFSGTLFRMKFLSILSGVTEVILFLGAAINKGLHDNLFVINK